MPLEQAIEMMVKSYELYMDQLLSKKNKQSPPSKEIAYLLRVCFYIASYI